MSQMSPFLCRGCHLLMSQMSPFLCPKGCRGRHLLSRQRVSWMSPFVVETSSYVLDRSHARFVNILSLPELLEVAEYAAPIIYISPQESFRRESIYRHGRHDRQ